MRPTALIGLCTLLLALIPAAPAWAAPASAGCSYRLGFAAFHDLIPELIGPCVSDETHNPDNGDAIQQTANGLLVWRKADNWTAFTDGSYTWLNGPNSLQQRLNGERFNWEG